MSGDLASLVEVERGGGVAVVRIDDGKANAISLQLEHELKDAIEDAAGPLCQPQLRRIEQSIH